MCSNGLMENDEDWADMATTFEVEAKCNVVPFNWHICSPWSAGKCSAGAARIGWGRMRPVLVHVPRSP